MNERHVGGLWCSQVLQRLGDYVDGQLDANEVSLLTAHVRECDQCASFGASYAAVVAALQSGRDAPSVTLDAQRMQRLRRALKGS